MADEGLRTHVALALTVAVGVIALAIAGGIGDFLVQTLGNSVNSTFGADILNATKGSIISLGQLLTVFAVAVIAIAIMTYLWRNVINA